MKPREKKSFFWYGTRISEEDNCTVRIEYISTEGTLVSIYYTKEREIVAYPHVLKNLDPTNLTGRSADLAVQLVDIKN